MLLEVYLPVPSHTVPLPGDNHFRCVVAELLSIKISISLSVCGLLVPGHYSPLLLTPKKQKFTNPQVLYIQPRQLSHILENL